MKKINYIAMIIAFAITFISMIVSVPDGIQHWAWQLATLTWIVNSFIQQRIIDNNKQAK